MSNDIAIRIDGVGKRYRIGVEGKSPYGNLRESLNKLARDPLSPFRGRGPMNETNSFWALKDVGFEVRQGEVVGIIGRNGAGKSTLLKVLSRITEPTTGEIMVRGRVGSLLEVGTGFHPELSGRENIFMNGAILGMSQREIRAKFDEIVDFSEVEKFLDTPVKQYSSGMYTRLAFAVAAHLEPEVLVVDEVLAVGDAAFQKKCLGKMQDVAGEGRTVLFVSHNMAAVESLCHRAVMLSDGRVEKAGSVDLIVKTYLQDITDQSTVKAGDRSDREGTGEARLVDIWFEDNDGSRINQAVSGQSLTVVMQVEMCNDIKPVLGLGFYNATGSCIAHNSTEFAQCNGEVSASGVARCQIPKLPLPAGSYRLNTSIRIQNIRVDRLEGAATLDVEAGDFYGTGKVPPPAFGAALIDHHWRFEAAGVTE